MPSPFQNVGHCIYCDSTEPPLTREHVLARGLGGNRAPNSASEAMVLQRATCDACREITRKIEQDCLRDMLGHGRTRMNLERKDRKRTYRKAKVRYHDGREGPQDLHVDYIPGTMVIPSFQPAAIFWGLDWPGPQPVEYLCILAEDHTRARDPDIHQITVEVKADTLSFARMLAKIGLGLAHYVLGPDVFVPIVRDFIRFGEPHQCCHFVGGYSGMDGAPSETTGNDLHRIALWHHQTFLVATIQLFAYFPNAPVNYAVIGPLRRVPPKLPHLHLGTQTQRPDKILSREVAGRPNETIRWDLSSPSSPESAAPETK